MIKDLRRSSFETPKFFDKFRFRQVVGGGKWVRDLRGSTSRKEQVLWFPLTGSVQVAGQFVADQSSHAVPEKGEWTIHVGGEPWRDCGNQVEEVRKRSFPHPSAPARELDRTYVKLQA
jgi:hypothetical protein